MNVAMVMAGGTGTRLGGDIPKQFIEVQGKPILAYSLEILEKNENIDVVEIVCHKDWIKEVEDICKKYNISKMKWICNGGNSFQESALNGVFNLKDKISKDDILVIHWGAAPLVPQEDINDSIRVCKEHGNGISSSSIDVTVCLKDDEYSSSKPFLRDNLKGFINPWTFNYGELLDAYELATEKDMLKDLDPYPTSLYLALGKKIWFSQSTTPLVKITRKSDIDLFKAYLVMKEQ